LRHTILDQRGGQLTGGNLLDALGFICEHSTTRQHHERIDEPFSEKQSSTRRDGVFLQALKQELTGA